MSSSDLFMACETLIILSEEDFYIFTIATATSDLPRIAWGFIVSKPVSDTFFNWVESLVALPKSLLGEAVHYSLSQRKYLENVYLDGRLELSNNRAERSVKPFVIGRKNWLFAASKDGARASSIVCSIVETARENGLRSFQYMQYLLETLPHSAAANLEALLPVECYLPA